MRNFCLVGHNKCTLVILNLSNCPKQSAEKIEDFPKFKDIHTLRLNKKVSFFTVCFSPFLTKYLKKVPFLPKIQSDFVKPFNEAMILFEISCPRALVEYSLPCSCFMFSKLTVGQELHRKENKIKEFIQFVFHLQYLLKNAIKTFYTMASVHPVYNQHLNFLHNKLIY